MWRFTLADLKGNRLGELEGATKRQLYRGLSKNPTCSLDVPITGDNPLVEELLDNDMWAILLAERRSPYSGDWELRFAGPVVNCEEVAEYGTPTLSILAVGPWLRLSKRIADNPERQGRTREGLVIPQGETRRSYAAALINYSDLVDGPHWITASLGDQYPEEPDNEVALSAPWGGFKRLDEAIADLADVYGGFEWVLDPIFEVAGNRLFLGRYRSRQLWGEDRVPTDDWRGRNKPGVVALEYGMGQHNLKSVRRQRTLENYINRATHVNSDFNPFVVMSQDDLGVSQVGVWEELIASDLSDQGFRRKLTDVHSAVRAQGPRLVVDAETTRSDLGGYVPGVDYDVGDRVGLDAFYGGKLRLTGGVRIYDMTIEIGDGGEETAKLTLYQD